MAAAMLKLGLLGAEDFMCVGVDSQAIDVTDSGQVVIESLRESEPVNKHKGTLFRLVTKSQMISARFIA